jgi:dipeptidyl aminopeptidase/acylaminoacyl peptidase
MPFMDYVQSTPPDGRRPRLYRERYALVGDGAITTAELVVVDVGTGQVTPAAGQPIIVPFQSPITAGQVWWNRDGRRIYFVCGDRGDLTLRLHEIDPDNGATRLFVEERGGDLQLQAAPRGLGRPIAHVLATGETIWWSERSGWGHLYLYAADGRVRALTGGEWLVRDLVAVNEEERLAVFSGAGREEGLDPYVRQLYRVGLDDGDIERLSTDCFDHEAIGTRSGRYLVDVTSWVDTPEASCVRDSSGTVVVELEHSDASLLYETGWTPPERFRVKAADGVTDLYGNLYAPHSFDPASLCPVLDDIYPGPQINAASVRFLERTTAAHASSMAALGFAVVVIDGRGTPLRSKAFQEHCRGSRDSDYLDDHISAIRQLAATRPWLDIDRVGIYGHSGGGRASTSALLRRPEFFKVAVSTSGNHDDLIYHPGWGEKYIGPVDVADYRDHANATYAEQLQGKLLLIHGELDNNVSPYLTLRLVDALMAANKEFDLLIIPNGDHALLARQEYWLRRRWDYFVRHLHGEEPPVYRIAEIPVTLETLAELLDRW